MDENARPKTALRRRLADDLNDFDALVGLIALAAKGDMAVRELELEGWLQSASRTLGVSARQRYSLASLLFTMGRYQPAWEQCWAGMHSKGLDDRVRKDLAELIRILRDDLSSPS